MTLSPCPSDESPGIGAETRVCVCIKRDTHRFLFSWGSRHCSVLSSFLTLSCLTLCSWGVFFHCSWRGRGQHGRAGGPLLSPSLPHDPRSPETTLRVPEPSNGRRTGRAREPEQLPRQPLNRLRAAVRTQVEKTPWCWQRLLVFARLFSLNLWSLSISGGVLSCY